MGRVYTCVLLLAFAHTSLPLTDWTAIAKKTGESVVRVEASGATCTGFVINDDVKGERDAVLTAAHCAGEEKADIYADSAIARIIWKNSKADLMILDVADTGRPALTIALTNPRVGEDVGSYGYGYALERPMFRLAHVSDDAAQIPDVEGGPFIMIDAGYVPGQSGGPCLNDKGEVVSIVQQASGLVGIGVGAESLRDKVKRYLPKPKP